MAGVSRHRPWVLQVFEDVLDEVNAFLSTREKQLDMGADTREVLVLLDVNELAIDVEQGGLSPDEADLHVHIDIRSQVGFDYEEERPCPFADVEVETHLFGAFNGVVDGVVEPSILEHDLQAGFDFTGGQVRVLCPENDVVVDELVVFLFHIKFV